MNMNTKLARLAVAAALLGSAHFAAAQVKVRLGTLAPKGSSYTKHLQAMGDQWRQAPGGGVQLTLYPDGTMGSEADMVRRMRLGQLQAAMVTTTGITEIEPGAAGLQTIPKAFRSLEEVDYIGAKLQPLLETRLEAKGFVVLFWSDTGFVRFFSKQPVVTPDDLRNTKLFVSANRSEELNIYRLVGCNPVPLEVADMLPGLQTGLIDCLCTPPTIALALQVDAAAPTCSR
jgi:TRAP-type C4-dicarboxylate transport system substrate-binding protein